MRVRVVVSIALLSCLAFGACSSSSPPSGPKFTGRVLLLTGTGADGADLVELSAAPNGSGYNLSTLTKGVFEGAPNLDQTELVFATRNEVALRDLRTNAVKSLIKGPGFCLAWAPDGKHFSYAQKEGDAGGKLYVSDLEGKTKLVADNAAASYEKGSSSAGEGSATESYCAQWIAPDRLVFDRFLGALPKDKKGAEALKPNTTTIATVGDTVKLHDVQRKWSIESVCPKSNTAFVRPPDESQILIARNIDHFETIDPSPGPCSACRFVGYAAQSCVPFFIEQQTSTATDLFSLNPTNWQKQRPASISQTFSLNAKMLIKSSARLMIVGDAPSTLLLIDTESGEIVPFFPKSASGQQALTSPVPVVWIEK